MRSWRHVALLAIAGVLVSSTARLVDHDHTVETEPAAALCAVDHSRESVRSSPPGSTPELGPSGPSHQHRCLGCHLSRQRSSIGPAWAVYECLGDSHHQELPCPPCSLLAGALSDHAPRGPPRA